MFLKNWCNSRLSLFFVLIIPWSSFNLIDFYFPPSGKDSSWQLQLLLVLDFWVHLLLIIYHCFSFVVWLVLVWEAALCFHPGFWNSFLLQTEVHGWLFFQPFGLLEQFLRLHLHGYASNYLKVLLDEFLWNFTKILMSLVFPLLAK